VLQAREQIGNEPFLCMLGDTIFSGDVAPAKQLVDAYQKLGTAIIAVEEVPPEKVSRYGIVGGQQVAPGIFKLDKLVEKPRENEAPSRMAVAARYLLTPTIFECLDRTAPEFGGEIQITDALQLLSRASRFTLLSFAPSDTTSARRSTGSRPTSTSRGATRRHGAKFFRSCASSWNENFSCDTY
jgi:UTP-glucose-1-phosphate uridylyltransferase